MSVKGRIFEKAGGGTVRDVPEWGCSVLLRGMPASMRLKIAKARAAGTLDNDAMMIEALQRCVRDPDVEGHPPVFSDVEVQQLLDEDTQGVTDRLLTDIFELSGVTKEAIDEARRRFLGKPSSEPSSSSDNVSAVPSTSSSPDEEDPSVPEN